MCFTFELDMGVLTSLGSDFDSLCPTKIGYLSFTYRPSGVFWYVDILFRVLYSWHYVVDPKKEAHLVGSRVTAI